MLNLNSEVLKRIVKLINLIGKTGINDIDYINSFLDTTKIELELIGNGNVGAAWHYYDYTLSLKQDNTIKLVIKSEAADESPVDNGHNYITKVTVMFWGNDNKDFTVTLYMYRWNYEILQNLNVDSFIELAKQNKNNRLNEAPQDFEIATFKIAEYDDLISTFDKLIQSANMQREDDELYIKTTLKSMSPKQLHILKKMMNEVKNK